MGNECLKEKSLFFETLPENKYEFTKEVADLLRLTPQELTKIIRLLERAYCSIITLKINETIITLSSIRDIDKTKSPVKISVTTSEKNCQKSFEITLPEGFQSEL